jgi:hypothetical protein
MLVSWRFPKLLTPSCSGLLASLLWGVAMGQPLVNKRNPPETRPLAAVQIHNKWAYIDTTGALAMPPWFLQATDFSEGLAAVQFSNSLWGYVDKRGMVVVPGRYQAALPFHKGQARVKLQARWQVINAWGEVLPEVSPNLPPVADTLVACEWWTPAPHERHPEYPPFAWRRKRQGLRLQQPQSADTDTLPPLDSLHCLAQPLGCLLFSQGQAHWIDTTGHLWPLLPVTSALRCQPGTHWLWLLSQATPGGAPWRISLISDNGVAHSPALPVAPQLPLPLSHNRAPLQLSTPPTAPQTGDGLVSGGTWGYLDIHMRVAIPPVFQAARPFF